MTSCDGQTRRPDVGRAAGLCDLASSSWSTRPAERRPLRSATVSPDRRRRDRTCGPCVGRCFTGQRGAFPPRRVSAFALAELVELVGERGVDVGAALGEHVEQLVGDAGDLGLTVDDRPPLDAEAVGQLGAQHRLVQAAEHPLMPLQVAGVERVPAAVGGLHLGRDHGVGVDLRIIGPRRRLAERRHRQPVRVRMQTAAVGRGSGSSTRTAPDAPAPRSTATSWASSSRSSPVSAHHTDSDFGAENVASNPDTARTSRPSARVPVQQLATQPCPRCRVTARQQRLQRVHLDPTRQAETGRLTARPHPRHLARRRRRGTARSTPPSPPPTTRAGSSPAASAREPLPPARGHLSALTWTTDAELGVLSTGAPQAEGRRTSCSTATATGCGGTPGSSLTASTCGCRGRRDARCGGSGHRVDASTGRRPSEPAGALRRWTAATRPAPRSAARRALCGVRRDTDARGDVTHRAAHDPRLAVLGGRRGEHLERAPRRRSDRPPDLRGRGADDHGDVPRGRRTASARRSIGQTRRHGRWSAARPAPSAAPGCTTRTAAPASRRDRRTPRTDAPSRRPAIARSAAPPRPRRSSATAGSHQEHPNTSTLLIPLLTTM